MKVYLLTIPSYGTLGVVTKEKLQELLKSDQYITYIEYELDNIVLPNKTRTTPSKGELEV
jgi:hypothetical protein